MSIFKRNDVLCGIKTKKEFLSRINKGAAINYIGVTFGRDFDLIGDIVLDYVSRDFERKLLILSSMTSTQICFKLNSILKDYGHKVVTNEGFLTIEFENTQHKIHVQHYPTHGIDPQIFYYTFEVLLHLPLHNSLDVKLLKGIHSTPNKSNLTILAPYGCNEDISLKTLFILRKYLNNMALIDYDNEENKCRCFIDIYDKTYTFVVIKEEIQRL